jgi:hypothetical protein
MSATQRFFHGPAIVLAVTFLCSAAALAQIDFRAPREAGRVWERKIDENNRKKQTDESKAADAAWERPLTSAQLDRTRSRNKAEYDRKASRFGKPYADQWLDRQARMERYQVGK